MLNHCPAVQLLTSKYIMYVDSLVLSKSDKYLFALLYFLDIVLKPIIFKKQQIFGSVNNSNFMPVILRHACHRSILSNLRHKFLKFYKMSASNKTFDITVMIISKWMHVELVSNWFRMHVFIVWDLFLC